MVHKALCDVVQSIFEQAHSPSPMRQNFYRFDVFVNINSNKVAPHVRNHDDGEQIRHTPTVPDMRAFDVKPAGFQALKQGLHLPSLAVHFKRFLCVAV